MKTTSETNINASKRVCTTLWIEEWRKLETSYSKTL